MGQGRRQRADRPSRPAVPQPSPAGSRPAAATRSVPKFGPPRPCAEVRSARGGSRAGGESIPCWGLTRRLSGAGVGAVIVKCPSHCSNGLPTPAASSSSLVCSSHLSPTLKHEMIHICKHSPHTPHRGYRVHPFRPAAETVTAAPLTGFTLHSWLASCCAAAVAYRQLQLAHPQGIWSAGDPPVPPRRWLGGTTATYSGGAHSSR